MKPILPAIVAALVLPIGLYIPGLWFASILGFIPLSYALSLIRRTQLRNTFLTGWAFGSVYSGGTVIWFWHTLPLDWLGLSNSFAGALFVFIHWGIVAIVTGLFFGLFAILFVRLRNGSVIDSVIGACLWTLVQYAQLWGFAFLTAGEGSLLGAHFSPFLLGYAAAWFSPLLQFASIGGVYVLTFLLALFGFLFSWSILSHTAPRRTVAALSLGVLVGLTVLDQLYFLVNAPSAPTGQTATIAIVSTDFETTAKSPEERLARGAKLNNVVREWASQNTPPDLLIFPEGAIFFETSGQTPEQFRREVFGDAPVSIVDSAPYTNQKNQRSIRMYVYGPDSQLVTTYDKMFLVPQGEYLPYASQSFPRLLGGEQFEKNMKLYHIFTRGDSVEVADIGSIRIGGLFCADILSPRLYRETAEKSANLLINPASQSLFHGSRTVETHILAMAKVRAVENNRYFAMAGNSFISTIIAPNGELVAETRGMSVLAAPVRLIEEKTLYTRVGEGIIFLPAVYILLTLLFARKRDDEPTDTRS